jgi:tetratricopeptide (TPR) repeat protein
MPASDRDRWGRVLSVFDEVVELAPSARRRRLAAIGADDPELQRSVEALLDADAGADVRLARLDGLLGSRDAQAGEHDDQDPLKLIGRTVSHFRVIAPLARGGMGIVYRAEDVQLGRAVALKFPLESERLDRRAKERFIHEARLAGALDHPNLCGIYEAGETDDGRLFHAMPLYAGETLRDRLTRDGALPVADALAITKQIAHGLGAAHRAGIVHRDLKPANVMLLPDGVVKILDFGLARAKDLGLTASQTALGTVSYMAPEQILGRSIDGRTDLWSLGVVMYEMLTGRRPFVGEEPVSVAHAIVHTEPGLPSDARDDVPAAVDAVVRTLMRKDRAERYASAEDVATALAVVQVGGEHAAAASPGLRVAALGRRIAWRRTALLTIPVASALGVGAWLTLRNRSPASAPRAVVVVPFTDSGDDNAGAHTALGLSDAIGTTLSRMTGVAVRVPPARLLARGATPSPAELAAALEASAVVTGAVGRTGGRVQLHVQLFDSGAASPRWEKRYDRLSDEVAEIERDATREIVRALRVHVTDAERARLDRPLTTSVAAYDLYLRGRIAELGDPRRDASPITQERTRTAVSYYSQARQLDPSFAVARARLAIMFMRAAATYDTTTARREQARIEAEEALRLDPGLFEAHTALAVYWGWRELDTEKAVAGLLRALETAPHRADLHVRLGDAYVRASRWEDAVVKYERAMRLDPQNPQPAMQAALAYTRVRRDPEAMRAYDRAAALDPDEHMIRVIKGHTYLRWKGVADTLAAVMRSVPSGWDPSGMATWARYTVLRVQRRYAEALAMLDSSDSELSRDGFVYQPTALMRAQSHEALGHGAAARAYYERARRMLTDSVAAHPDNPGIRVVLGLVHAALGNRAAAVREARQAEALMPVSRSGVAATAFMGVAVEVYAAAGELDAAFERLELLLAMPAGREATIPYLRLWPGFDPLRGDPRFEQLLARFGSPG